MFLLYTILTFFLSPLCLSLVLLILFFIYRKKTFVFLGLLILLVSSNSYVSNYLTKQLEYPYKLIPISLIKENDAVVVLSGIIHQVGDKNYSTYEFSDPDRFFAGIELIKQKKSDKLIFTAGQLPWTENWKPEGYILKDKAISLGVRSPILVTNNVKNTDGESIAVTKIVPSKSSIVLVTSAFHIQRSNYFFENKGFAIMTCRVAY